MDRVGYHSWCHKELDMIEMTKQALNLAINILINKEIRWKGKLFFTIEFQLLSEERVMEI